MKCPECGETIEPNEYRNIYKCPGCARMFTLSSTLTRIPIIKRNALHSEPIGIYCYTLAGLNDSPVYERPIYAKIDSYNKYKDLKEEIIKDRELDTTRYSIQTVNIIYF